jgi:hypothetical protein
MARRRELEVMRFVFAAFNAAIRIVMQHVPENAFAIGAIPLSVEYMHVPELVHLRTRHDVFFRELRRQFQELPIARFGALRFLRRQRASIPVQQLGLDSS